MSEDKRYNGWTNYETWNWNLWMTNDEGSQETLNELGTQAWDEANGDTKDEKLDDAKNILSATLKSYTDEIMPDLGSSMFADMLGAAISEIDWYKLADHILSDMDLEFD